MVNSHYWHWYPNSDEEGIHFSFAKQHFALKFKKRFKTGEIYEVTDVTKRIWYCIKILDQDTPTEKNFTWLERCKVDGEKK